MDAPECPAGCGPCATPIADIGGGVTTERVDGPDDSTLWCPACGRGWCGTPEDVAQATAALAAYYRAERDPRAPSCAVTPPPTLDVGLRLLAQSETLPLEVAMLAEYDAERALRRAWALAGDLGVRALLDAVGADYDVGNTFCAACFTSTAVNADCRGCADVMRRQSACPVLDGGRLVPGDDDSEAAWRAREAALTPDPRQLALPGVSP